MVEQYLVGAAQVAKIGGFCKSHWYDIQNPRSPRFDPTVPKKVRISPRVVRYWHAEVIEWIESKRKATTNVR